MMNLCNSSTYLLEMAQCIKEWLFIISKSLFIYVIIRPQVVGLKSKKIVSIHSLCYNFSLGLATKARACKGAGQEGSP